MVSTFVFVGREAFGGLDHKTPRGYCSASEAPSKVLTFAWRLLLDRLPTCEQLQRQGVTIPNSDSS